MEKNEIKMLVKLRDELNGINPDPWENVERWATRAEIFMEQNSPQNLKKFVGYCHPFHPSPPTPDRYADFAPSRRTRSFTPPDYNKEKERIINFIDAIIEFNQNDRVSKSKNITVINKVFVVHGHNDGLRQSVARFIEKLGLEAIILNEKPNEGRTIIEKIEAHSSVGFAVVLLTPDDVGKLASEPKEKLSHRARQNVVLELGYFIAKLGRNRVCALLMEGVEKPSDYDGVLYTQVDDSGAWQLKLAKELKAAGLNIDLNKI